MKKPVFDITDRFWQTALLLFVLLLCFSACSGEPQPTTTDQETSSETGELTEAVESTEPKSTAAEPEAKTVMARGIDLSRWQGDVDWEAVKNSGEVDFALVRLGTRPEDALFYTDSKGTVNLAGANAAGVPAGAYFYTVPVSAEHSREDAQWVLEAVKDYDIACPLVYDVEANKTDHVLSATARTDCALAFAREIRAAGYQPMLYVPLEELEDPALWEKERLLGEILLWVAWYEAPVYPTSDFPAGREEYDAWQYSNTGSVPGITENVDLDLFYFPIG